MMEDAEFERQLREGREMTAKENAEMASDANYKTIRFGLGEVICTKATVGRYPAVTLEPAGVPGKVGSSGPDLPNDKLRDGSTVLEFHGKEGAQVLIEDIVHSLFKADRNLSPFLLRLAEEIDALQKAKREVSNA